MVRQAYIRHKRDKKVNVQTTFETVTIGGEKRRIVKLKPHRFEKSPSMMIKERIRKQGLKRNKQLRHSKDMKEQIFKPGSKMFPDLSKPSRHPKHRTSNPPYRLRTNGVRKKLFWKDRKDRLRPWIPVAHPAEKRPSRDVNKRERQYKIDEGRTYITPKQKEALNSNWLKHLEETERDEIHTIYGARKDELLELLPSIGKEIHDEQLLILEGCKSQAWGLLRSRQTERINTRKEQEVRLYMKDSTGDDMAKAKATWIIWFGHHPRNWKSWSTKQFGVTLRKGE